MRHDADANHPLGRRVLRSLYEQLLKARHAERWTGTAADSKRGEAVFVGATAGLTARDAVIRVEDDVARLAVACENLPKNAVAVVLLSSESAMVKAAAANPNLIESSTVEPSCKATEPPYGSPVFVVVALWAASTPPE